MRRTRNPDGGVAVAGPRTGPAPASDGRPDTDVTSIEALERGPAASKRPLHGSQLATLRRRFRREAIERRDVHSEGRQLRLLAYSLVLSRGLGPDDDWNTLQAEAERRGYAIGARFHDVAVPVTTTYITGSRAGRGVYLPPWKRPGWGEVERLIRGGFADGVIVIDRHNISSDDDEYRFVIEKLGEQYRAFVHLVIPEEPTAPT
ncbi:hypothetical protein ACFWF9_21975 [Streptomyces roseolus]|uniref:hypothetical protein n=1 Tax=Streptomyces roseolus TaxID=67358 RepID=UPI003664B041